MAAEPLAAPGIDWPLGAVTRRRPRAHAAGGAGGGGAGLRGGARAAGGGGAGEAGGGRLPGRLSGLPPAPSRLLWLRPCADPRRGPLRPCPAARLPPGTPAASGAAQTHEARAPRRRCRRDGAPGPRGGAEDQCGSGIDSSGESAAGRVLHPGESRASTRTGSRGDPHSCDPLPPSRSGSVPRDSASALPSPSACTPSFGPCDPHPDTVSACSKRPTPTSQPLESTQGLMQTSLNKPRVRSLGAAPAPCGGICLTAR